MVKIEDLQEGQYLHYLSRDIQGNQQETWGTLIRLAKNPKFFIAEIKPDKGNILAETSLITKIDDIIKIEKRE